MGNLISLSLMFLQKYFMIFKLDPNTYYSDYVPIDIDPFNLFLTISLCLYSSYSFSNSSFSDSKLPTISLKDKVGSPSGS